MIAFLRRMLPLLGVVVLIGAAYDGWIFYGRWQSGREAERARADAEAERARKTIDAIGGGGFGIRNFYGSPPAIHIGEAATLCYSVMGAPPRCDSIRPWPRSTPRSTTACKLRRGKIPSLR